MKRDQKQPDEMEEYLLMKKVLEILERIEKSQFMKKWAEEQKKEKKEDGKQSH